MENSAIMLYILSPEKTVFEGKVSAVHLPGAKAPFAVLHNHAPLITTLESGTVRWISAEGGGEFAVSGGFAEVKDNHVTLCVETL